jgi:hypothetical protein
VHVIPLPE